MNTRALQGVKNVGLFGLFWASVIQRFYSPTRDWKHDLLKTVGDYKLFQVIEKENSTPDFYRFGIYQNSNGQKAFAKQWSGRLRNIEYFWLYNEIQVYRAIHDVYVKRGDSLAKKYPTVRVPRLLHIVQEPGRLVLMTEFVEGDVLELAPDVNGIFAIEQALQYFIDISDHLDKTFSHYFVKRGAWYIVGNFFIMLVAAAAQHPRTIPGLFRSLSLFVSSIPTLLRNNTIRLVHRDLTYFNILVSKTDFYLIDFELSVLTHPMFEVTQIVTGSWRRKGFWQEFYKSATMKNILNDPLQHKLYRALTLYTGVHRLGTCVREERDLHYSYLLHGINLSSEIKKI